MTKPIEEDALEQVRCAIINMANLKKVMPSAGASPFFKIVLMQLEAAELILEGKEDGEI